MAEPIQPLADAVERLSKKTPIGSVLRSQEWEQVPLMLRERAQFSAGVTSLRLLQAIQDRLASQVKQEREKLAGGKEAIFDRSSFIDSIRQIGRDEGLTPQEPEKRGGLQDITSIPRLGMIYDMQNAMASGYATWKLDQNEGAMALWPAYRFGPSTARVPRTTWMERWQKAGGAVGWVGAHREQMVALKNSPIWAALSRFGTPWPPFDYGSTRELEDVEREEAIALGLIGPNDVPSGGEESFNRNLQASVEGLSPKMQGTLKGFFGDQVKIDGGAAEWTGQTAEPEPAPSAEAASAGAGVPISEPAPAASQQVNAAADDNSAFGTVAPFHAEYSREETRLAGLTKREEAAAFGPDGSVLFKVKGKKSSVSFTAAQVKQLQAAGNVTLVHNHPGGGSFSFDDLKTAAKCRLRGIVAVGVKGKYSYFIRPKGAWPDMAEVAKTVKKVDAELLEKFKPLVKDKHMTVDEAYWAHSHERWVEVAQKHGLIYERRERTA